MATAANTPDCFREAIGHQIVGVLFDALPLNDRRLAAGNKTLVLDDGRGLTISNNGSYWIESAEDVRRAAVRIEAKLKDTKRDLKDVLKLAGALA